MDDESMLYWKQLPDGHAFIDITWLDTTRSDPYYGTGREYCVCTGVEDADVDYEEAAERFQNLRHTDGYCISDVVSRADAERIVLEYIEGH